MSDYSSTTYYRLTEYHGYGDDTPDWAEALNRAYVRLDKLQAQNLDRGTLVPLEVTIDERTREEWRDADGTLLKGVDSVGRRYKLSVTPASFRGQ